MINQQCLAAAMCTVLTCESVIRPLPSAAPRAVVQKPLQQCRHSVKLMRQHTRNKQFATCVCKVIVNYVNVRVGEMEFSVK